MPLTQSGQEHAGAVEVTRREEDNVVAEEDEVAKEDVDPRTTPREAWSRSLSLSRNPSLREEPAKSKDRRWLPPPNLTDVMAMQN
jgi:hypothetical protein